MENEEPVKSESEKKELLTEEELSALLENKSADGNERAGGEKRSRIIPYNFRRPDRVSKEQVRSLYMLHDTFARNLSSNLPIFLRAISEVTLISIEQESYLEYLSELPDPTVTFQLSMNPLQGMVILEINSSVAFPVIDRQLGGAGKALAEPRAITEIEQVILEGFLKVLIEALHLAWKPIIELDFQVLACENNPKMLQIVAPHEVVLAIVFQVRIADTQGTISLCIPAINLEPVIQKLNQSSYSRISNVPVDQTRGMIDNLSLISFPVAAEVHGTTVKIKDLLLLSPGDIIRLDHRVSDPVCVSIGDKVKFHGELVANGKRTAVHISDAVV